MVYKISPIGMSPLWTDIATVSVLWQSALRRRFYRQVIQIGEREGSQVHPEKMPIGSTMTEKQSLFLYNLHCSSSSIDRWCKSSCTSFVASLLPSNLVFSKAVLGTDGPYLALKNRSTASSANYFTPPIMLHVTKPDSSSVRPLQKRVGCVTRPGAEQEKDFIGFEKCHVDKC
jgi:hypothetical protein